MLEIADHRLMYPEERQELRAVSCILGGDEIHAGERLLRPVGQVGEVPDRRRHEVQSSADDAILAVVLRIFRITRYLLRALVFFRKH